MIKSKLKMLNAPEFQLKKIVSSTAARMEKEGQINCNIHVDSIFMFLCQSVDETASIDANNVLLADAWSIIDD